MDLEGKKQADLQMALLKVQKRTKQKYLFVIGLLKMFNMHSICMFFRRVSTFSQIFQKR